MRRRAQNAIDTWDGRYYRRALVVDGAPVELAVRQVEGKHAPVLEVVLSGQRVGPAAEAAARSMLARPSVHASGTDLRPEAELGSR